jgi:Mn2+/Fe2+ NRAMP family transporter
MGDAAALVLGGNEPWYAAGFGVFSLGLLVVLPYQRYVKILKWFTLSLLAYVAVAFSVHLDWIAVFKSTVWPSVTWSKDYATTIVAILGTTISPYLFFWQADQEVEEIKRVTADKPLRMAPEQVRRHFRRLKVDTCVGMGFSNAIAFFMIVSTAATLHAHGIVKIDSTTQAAEALRPIAGDAAFFLFALGIIGTGMLAIPVLGGSAAYAVASVFKWKKGLDRSLGRAAPFYGVIAAAIGVGIAMSFANLDPIQTLYWSAVINALISVPIMVVVMLTASSPKVMGKLTLSLKWKSVGWIATAAMAAATLVMGWSFVA